MPKPALSPALPFVSCISASELIEVQAGEGADALPKFSMTAYTGGKMRVAGYYYPVVVNLANAKAAGTVAILKDHDAGRVVGHADGVDVVISAQRIKASGVISGTGPHAAEVVATSKNKFPWQASIGGSPAEVHFIDRGEKQTVNGRVVEGPCYRLDGVTIREISFVALGADGNTSANVAASFYLEVSAMNFTEWLAAKKIDEATLSKEVKEFMQAQFDAEVELKAKGGSGNTPPPENKPVEGGGTGNVDPADAAIKRMNDSFVANAVRVEKIQSLCKGHPDIMAKAIGENWPVNEAELAVLRAERAKPAHTPSGGGAGGGVFSPRMLEAAIAVAGNLPNHEKIYNDQELQAAHTAFKGRIGLQEVFITAAQASGWHGRSFKQEPEACLRAAFSTVSLPGILSNIANKFLLAGYNSVEDTWRRIAGIRSVSDFKQVTSYRLTGDANFEKVGPTGELAHGTLGEQTYTNQAETYGKMYAITRTMLINDDLDALSQIPRIIGRGSALNFNSVFWTEFLNNATLFAATHTAAGDTGNANLATGAGSALSIDALTAAELLFYNQVDPNNNPLGVMAKLLLVPNALYVKGNQFSRDTEVRDTSSNKVYTTQNPHAGKWECLRSSYLSNALISGYSTTAWYLLADPSDVATIEVAFLNGNQSPIVESADADFNTLGVQMRGYFDFGVNQQDFRGGVKSDGA